jgi:gluconokinase
MPHYFFLFGLSGAGKNYVGQVFQKRFGYTFIDCDKYITPAMLEAIAKKQSFSDTIRDDFFNKLVLYIQDHFTQVSVQQPNQNTIFAQGAYKNKHRKFLMEHFPSLKMVHVKASIETILKRFAEHEKHKVLDPSIQTSITKDYAEKIMHNFEEPDHKHECIINELGEESIVAQIEKLLNDYYGKNV